MNTYEVADKLVQLWSEEKNEEAIKELYSVENVSQRSFLVSRRKRGDQQMLSSSQFMLMTVEEFHSMELSEPLVLGEYFCVGLRMEFTIKGLGRSSIRESWVFEVKKGKIIYERYFHNGGADL